MISNSQDCQNLIQNINSAIVTNQEFMQNPEEQYKQRNKYIEVLEYAINHNELYHLYDIWQVFAQARNEATRGFFLDLWDLYKKQPDSKKNQRESDILRYFVCQVHNQFDQILDVEKITAPKLWRNYVRELLLKLIGIENQQQMQLERKLLYSMSHLYVYLYPNKSMFFEEEKDFFIHQLQITEEAINCRAKEKNSSLVLAQIFGNEENTDLQSEFTLSFLYLYRFVSHFAVISLKNFIKQVINSLKEEELIKRVGQETGEELLDRLLRYWGANSPLMRFFLEEKLDFRFYQYTQAEAINLPSPYGTDNFVYTIGASGVGKTYFFHAMDYFSKKSEEQLTLSIEYIDASEENRLDRKKWEEGEELKARENYLIYMRSKVRNLCRFTFYEIEDTQIIENTITKWQSLQGYFERRLPSAIILVFSPEEKDDLKSYDFFVNSLDKLATTDERYRNIPIYFIFNKSDQLLEKIQQSQECSRQLLNEFQSYLNSQIELSEGFNFFSLRYQKDVKQIGTLEIVNRTKACCANLAFIARLNQDIKRVKKIIDSLLEKDFTNLSFIYTCSLFKDGSQYTDLQNLWSDLSNFIIKATCKSLEEYYKREFQRKLNSDFNKVDRFYSNAELKPSLEFSKDREGKDVFQRLNETPDVQKIKEDFGNLMKIMENKDEITKSDLLLLSSGVQSALKDFFKEKNLFSDYLDKNLRENLKEIGVPVEIEESQGSQTYQDFPLRKIEFIEPQDINYYEDIWQFYVKVPSVESFIEDIKYQQITEEIRNIFYQGILEYNKNMLEKDRIKIENENNLELIIKQFPKQLQFIDIANRSQAFEASIKDKFLFTDALNNTSALCPVQCGKFENSDRSLIQGNAALEQTVFERLCQFTDLDSAAKYCQLLSNYLPKFPNKTNYPQFVIVKRNHLDKIQVEFDEIKIEVVKNLDLRLNNLQKVLLNTIKILLKNWHEFRMIYENFSDKYEYQEHMENLYLAKYLLKMLELHDFRIDQFQQEPEEAIKKINSTVNNLIYIMNISKAEPEKTNLESLREDYTEITSSQKILSLNIRDINSIGRKIEIELKTASSIYKQIFALFEKDKERLKSLSKEKDILQRFTFSQNNEYNNYLKDYEKQRKLLIIRERVDYLQTSKWVEDLQWLNDSFREYVANLTFSNLISMGTTELNEWKQKFIKDIDKLLETELLSQGTK